MDRQQIIMNFTMPPTDDDLRAIAKTTLETLPDELSSFCEDIVVQVEDLPDEVLEQELELDDPFDLTCLYRDGKEVSPGVKRKVANDDNVLILFRRPILDLWCETCDDLTQIVRQVMIEELAANFDFSDDEIDDMTQRHYQGML